MRLRIAMGVGYCLDHMHQLDPPVVHRHLCSSSVYLTEDYAAKLSDFSYWIEATAAKLGSATVEEHNVLKVHTSYNVKLDIRGT
ncbi:hypothetical protein Csa_011201 [Cucumis sativus]|nr:hypothetical protein Csa_011201 [Cucumis sativus]